MRQVVLDTETTGLDVAAGHRIIEIGCVELLHRRHSDRHFHRYVNPGRAVDAGALAVHGITDEFLARQPAFADVAAEFVEFVTGAELVIHNAEFDVGFINDELKRLPGMPADIRDVCTVHDTLTYARRMHPGQRASLDALARRYGIDSSMRELHGALLDARILAEVYLAMTGGQVTLLLDEEPAESETAGSGGIATLSREGLRLLVLRASEAERAAHAAMLAHMQALSDEPPLFAEASVTPLADTA